MQQPSALWWPSLLSPPCPPPKHRAPSHSKVPLFFLEEQLAWWCTPPPLSTPHCPCVCVCMHAWCSPWLAIGLVGPRPPGSRGPNIAPPASQLQARAPGEVAHLPSYCAGAMFVQQLLSTGYGFDERAFSRVTFQKKVGTGERAGPPGWRRGLRGGAKAESALFTRRRPGTLRSAGRLATC